jgi:uncharacterized membrane protein YphA (DoxX/SURF4 family)
MQKLITLFSRLLVGLVFVFSGLIKANDPIGFGYKLQEYFEVFHLGFLHNGATFFAIVICAAEIVLGILLLLGIYRKNVVNGLLALVVFFTFLTFVSAFFKVVTSCGCFGDAIPLTPWQSFTKDVILLVFILLLQRNVIFIQPITTQPKTSKLWFLGASVVGLGFGIFTYNFLPILDFLPYKVGANLPKSMRIPEGAAQDEYLILYDLKNKKTGETKQMSDKDYLSTGIWENDDWEVLSSPSRKLIKKGFQVKIPDLVISDANGTDYTKELVENPFYNLIVVAYDLPQTQWSAINQINALAINAAEQFNIRTVLLTSTSPKDVEVLLTKHKIAPEIFFADAVPLKSMVRANPGIFLLKNGTVIAKWHYHTLPSFDKLAETYFRK